MGKRGAFKNTLNNCVHERLNQKVKSDRLINKKDFFGMLGELYHVPKEKRMDVLNDMVALEMIEDLGNGNKNFIKVLPTS